MYDSEHVLPTDYLSQLHDENCEFYQSPKGRGALKDLQQTFPSPWLYVAELVQNAVDAEADCISFREPEPGTLILEHNGKAFDHRDVEGICTKGVSSKGAGTVGFMGVGFKAVFRSFETVRISSGPWKFQLQAKITKGEEYGDRQRNWLGAVLPHWAPDLSLPSDGFKCRFELTGRLEDLPPVAHDFKEIFHDSHTLMALLALRGVLEIDLFGTRWLLSEKTQKKEGSRARFLIEAMDEQSGQVRQWLLFRNAYTPSREAVRRFLEHRQINPTSEEKEKVYAEAASERLMEIFFPLDGEGCPDLPSQGEAYALLPTKQVVPFGVHINADWLLTVTRTDFMDLGEETNAWQSEIRAQIPSLVRDYLDWLCSDDGPQSMEWKKAYRIFPKVAEQPEDGSQTSNLGRWLLQDEFIDSLKTVLNEVSFLPDMGDEEGNFNFLSPQEGRLLPKALADAFEDQKQFSPWELFPVTAVSTHILGDRARNFLVTHGIIHEFSAEELAEYWGKDKIPAWYAEFSNDAKHLALFTFLKALKSDVDDLSEITGFYYLPADTGSWTNQQGVVRFPAEWGILVNEERLSEMLLPFLGQGKSLLDRQVDAYVTNHFPKFWDNRIKIDQVKLDQSVDRWWQSLPASNLSDDRIDDIVRFTCWVQEKQATRRALVSHLLAETSTGELGLYQISNVLLEGPYTGAFRKVFFPDLPVVSDLYYQNSSSEADWKGFLEGTMPRPQGRFHLQATKSTLCTDDAEKMAGAAVPDTRVTWHSEAWKKFPEIRVTSSGYTLVNFVFEEALFDQLIQQKDPEFYRAFGYWLDENPAQLREFVKQRILYIPYGASSITEIGLQAYCQWVNQLNEIKWVIAKDGSGPYRPRDILKRNDPARPEMPVADLSPDLIKILEQANILFESDVPQAGALKRLQFEGPKASFEQIEELLQECIEAVGKGEMSKADLEHALRRTPLFPRPGGWKFVDGSIRVSGNRLVLKAGAAHRSDLGWLCPVEDYTEGSTERRIINLVRAYLEIPAKTTWAHCMDFLEWVWSVGPDAEAIRQTLPRAYSYIAEDLELDSTGNERWEIIRRQARVFTLGRAWQSISGKQPVYFDDISTNLRAEIVPRHQLATAGHLGVKPTDDSLPDGVGLLNLPLLSSSYSLQAEPAEISQISSGWADRFRQIESFLHDLQAKRADLPEEEENEEEETQEEEVAFKFQLHSQIARKINCIATGKVLNVVRSWAERDGNVIKIAGSPREFAADLSLILCKAHGFSRRDDVTTQLAVLISLLDSAEFTACLSTLRKRLGIQPKEEIAAATEKGREQASPGGSPAAEPDTDDEDMEDDFEDDEESNEDEPEEDEDENDEDEEKRRRRGSSGRSTSSGNPPGGGPDSPEGSDGKQRKGTPPGGGRSHTPQDRERKLEWLMGQLNALKALGVKADIEDDDTDDQVGETASDVEYREAVEAYERQRGRYPVTKDGLQPGHDLDSFSSPDGTRDRRLVRRIEVKGRNHAWEGDETVELSHTQFKHALEKLEEEGVPLDDEFDYWVYIVEKQSDGSYRVLPVKNPALSSRKFELRAGTWNHFVEREGIVDLANKTVKSVPKPGGRSILDLRSNLNPVEEAEDDQP